MTDPELHIFLPEATDIATTDGSTYRLAFPPRTNLAAATGQDNHPRCSPCGSWRRRPIPPVGDDEAGADAPGSLRW